MTIHNPQNDNLTHSTQLPTSSKSPQPRHYRTMSTRNPFDYARLLFWVLFRPEMIKVYRIRCDVPQRSALRRQAMWLTAHLLWGSMLLAIVVPLGMGALPIDMWPAVVMITGIVGAWYLTGRFGLSEAHRLSNRLILGNLLISFGVIALIGITLNQITTTVLPVIVMNVIAVVAGLIALSVSSVFCLKTAEKIAGVITIAAVGGLSTLVFDLMEAAWIPVSVVIIAIFLVGIVEDRYDVSKHSQ